MTRISITSGLLALALGASLARADAATILNQDERAYALIVTGASSAETRIVLEPGKAATVNEQGMMRIEGQNAYSTLRPENEYLIQGGVFVSKPTPPPAPEVPPQSLPDASGAGAW